MKPSTERLWKLYCTFGRTALLASYFTVCLTIISVLPAGGSGYVTIEMNSIGEYWAEFLVYLSVVPYAIYFLRRELANVGV